MLDTRDRTFLNEVVQFTIMNHVAVVHLCRTRLASPTELAQQTVGSLRSYASDEELAETVAKNHDEVRIQRILIAKMFSELMAAYEDLGALGHAIRQRAKGGIFYQYLTSDAGDAANFLRFVFDTGSSAGLDTLLNLPRLSALARKKLGEDILTGITHDYRELPTALYQVAKMSLTPTGSIQQLEPGAGIASSWRDDLNILLNIDPPPTSATPSSRGATASAASKRKGETVGATQGATLVDAFNKIKHRFMVTDTLPDYVGASGSGTTVYGRFGMTESFVDMLVSNTVVSAQIMAELASLLLQLDGASIKL